MFAMACIDKQNEIDAEQKRRIEEKQRKAAIKEKRKILKDLSKKGIRPVPINKMVFDEKDPRHKKVETVYKLRPVGDSRSQLCNIL